MRKEFDSLVSRKHLVSRQDILNVKHQQDLSIIRHSDDATSVQLAVTALQQEKFNPILYFKPQHTVDENYPQLSQDTFALILQTDFQRQMYREFCSKIICIDSTHGTNSYKFKLVTLLVSDDFAAGLLQSIATKTCMSLLCRPTCWMVHYRQRRSRHGKTFPGEDKNAKSKL